MEAAAGCQPNCATAACADRPVASRRQRRQRAHDDAGRRPGHNLDHPSQEQMPSQRGPHVESCRARSSRNQRRATHGPAWRSTLGIVPRRRRSCSQEFARQITKSQRRQGDSEPGRPSMFRGSATPRARRFRRRLPHDLGALSRLESFLNLSCRFPWRRRCPRSSLRIHSRPGLAAGLGGLER